jgi:hypothetical protein
MLPDWSFCGANEIFFRIMPYPKIHEQQRGREGIVADTNNWTLLVKVLPAPMRWPYDRRVIRQKGLAFPAISNGSVNVVASARLYRRQWDPVLARPAGLLHAMVFKDLPTGCAALTPADTHEIP